MNVKNLLFIDSDVYWNQRLQQSCNRNDIKLEFIPSLLEAMQILNSGSNLYHCILINYSNISSSSNIDSLVNNIKSNAPFIKILFILDTNDPHKIVDITKTNANGYLIKPYSIENVLVEMEKKSSSFKPNINSINNSNEIKINGLSDLGIPNSNIGNIGRSDNMNNYDMNGYQNNMNNNQMPPNNYGNPQQNPNMNMGNPNMRGNQPPNMGGIPNGMGGIPNGGMPNGMPNPNMGGIPNGGMGGNPQQNPNMGMGNPNMRGNQPPNMGGMPNGMGGIPNGGMPNGMPNPNMGGIPNGGMPNGMPNPNMGGMPNGGMNGMPNPNMGGMPNGGMGGYQQNPNMGMGNPNMRGNQPPNMGGMPNGMGAMPNMGDQYGGMSQMRGNNSVVRIPKNTTIAIHCPKGGVGKSSISKELSIVYALSQVNGQKLKVCLVDMDIDYGDIAVMLELRQSKSISDWARNIRSRQTNTSDTDIRYSYEEVDRFYLLTHKSGLKVLAAPTNHRDAAMINDNNVKIIINNLKEMFDVIIIDTGNNVKNFTVTSMELADRLIMIGNTEVPTINELLTLGKTLDQIQFPHSKISLLMNEIKNGEEGQAQEIATYLGLPLIGRLPKVGAIEQANNNGEAIAMGPDNPFTIELKRVANSILPVVKKPNSPRGGGRGPSGKGGQPKKKGFFNKIFGK